MIGLISILIHVRPSVKREFLFKTRKMTTEQKVELLKIASQIKGVFCLEDVIKNYKTILETIQG